MFGKTLAGGMAEAIETEEKEALAQATRDKVRTADDHKSMLLEGLTIGLAGVGATVFAANRSKNSPGTRQVS